MTGTEPGTDPGTDRSIPGDRHGPADAAITVIAAVWRAVPRGAVRRRRERQLIAELYGRTRPRQAAGGLARLAASWAAESAAGAAKPLAGTGRRRTQRDG